MQSLQEVLNDHADVFKEELGTLQGVEVPVRVKSEAQPHFYRPRPVPYSMRQKVENELTRLQDGQPRCHHSSAVLRLGSTHCSCTEGRWFHKDLW